MEVSRPSYFRTFAVRQKLLCLLLNQINSTLVDGKNTNEDRKVFQDHFGEDPKKCFLAVYDGHHGHFAADMAATEFHHALLLEMQKFDLRTKINVAKDEIVTRDIESRAHSSRNSTTSMYSRESTVMLEQIVKTAREDELKTRQVKDDKDPDGQQ